MTQVRLLVNWLMGLAWFAVSGRPGFFARLRLGSRAFRAYLGLRKQSASSFTEQLILLNSVLNLDPAVPGDIAEFGCYKGAASAILSIGAEATGRRLVVFDSFEGLPEPSEAVHGIADKKAIGYRKGMYAGRQEEVRSNLERFGSINSTIFVKGFFSETLPLRPAGERYALIFEDADLVSSVRDVLRYAWPRLNSGCPFFSHEAHDLEVCGIFFDRDFWEANMSCPAPGLVGSGFGVPATIGNFNDFRIGPVPGRTGSYLAYVFKPVVADYVGVTDQTGADQTNGVNLSPVRGA